jgi:hypothetical protein
MVKKLDVNSMTSVQFCFWLQGLFEIGGDQFNTLNERQVQIIKNHLKLVFKFDIDPSFSSDPKVQEEMQEVHDGKDEPFVNNDNHLATPIPFIRPLSLQDIIDKNKEHFRSGSDMRAKC